MRPSVFEYLDYRKFLLDWADYKRKTSRFRVAEFASAAGFSSSSYWKMVVSAERNLSLEAARSVGSALVLRNEEKEFFCKLVLFNQEKDLQEKALIYRELLKFRRFREKNPEVKDQYAYYENWYIPVIFEAIQTPWNDLSLEEKASSFGLRREQIERAFEILSSLQLISKKKNRWIVTQSTLATPSEFQNVNLRNFHRHMISKGMSALDQLESNERFISGLTIAMSEKKFQSARERIFQFLKDMNDILSSPEDAERIYQLNLQLFPILSWKADDEKSVKKKSP